MSRTQDKHSQAGDGSGAGALIAFPVWRTGRRSTSVQQAPDSTVVDFATETTESAGGTWPRTNRVLPWLVAAFLMMVWLVPFDSILAPFSIGVDSRLDRVVLVLMAGVWLMLAAVGGRYGPRLRRSPVNTALVCLVAVALISIAVRLPALTHLDELSLAVKQTALLVAYVIFFFFVTSVVRPNEVRNFLKFMVILACVTAVGTVWEYRSGVDLFYSWSSSIFKGFTVLAPPTGSGGAFDRAGIVGPTGTSLADATLLAIALPFALVFLFEARDRRKKFLWYVATGLILAGTVSTLRKSAVLIPLGALVTLFVYSPKRMLRFTPALLVLVLAIKVIAPHAISQIKYQFENFNSSSTTHRTGEYPAVTADILAHPALGRGYGSYDPHKYMILDDQYLGLVIETGFIGLAAYVVVLLAGAILAHKAIRSRDPARGPPAIALMAAIVGYAVGSATYDILAFPQGPYMLMFVLGLAVVAADPSGRRVASGRAPTPTAGRSRRPKQSPPRYRRPAFGGVAAQTAADPASRRV